MMRTLIVIPARLGSWRFPKKPIEIINNMTMIEHVYRRAKMTSSVNEVVVATCDEEVKKAAEDFGAKVVMTSSDCPTACERVGEAARILGYTAETDIIINVQGDEPLVPPPVIELTRATLIQNPDCGVANLVEKVTDLKDLENHHRVKAIISKNNKMLYLSRSAIPCTAFDIKKRAEFLKLTCITAYRGNFLQAYADLERTPVELIEGNDMMRVIEHDIPIASGVSPYSTHPVDTPEDLEEVKGLMSSDEWYKTYSN